MYCLVPHSRYVRQDSPLWRALHAGILTSGTLNGALGFHEPTAIARLGLPKHFGTHGPLPAKHLYLASCWSNCSDQISCNVLQKCNEMEVL